MKKSIVLIFAIIAITAVSAFAQKPKQTNQTAKIINPQATKTIEGLTIANKKNGVSIIVLEANGGCATAMLSAATTIEQFLKEPNTTKSSTYKGLDASIADCCARSADGNFMLRINFVDCNGNAVTNRRPYEAVMRCSSKSSELIPLITRIIGTPSKGTTLYLKNIKVWQE